jgi:hypothetical protein
MKNLILILFVIFGMSAFGQRTLAVDTLQGAETVSFATMNNARVIQAVSTQLGGTSDGTLTLYGSIDGSNWVFINFLNAITGVASPKASITGADLNQITITSGLVSSWVVDPELYPYTKIVGVGTIGDTTQVAIKYSK